MSPPVYRKAGLYIDGVKTSDESPETIRRAVMAGKLVVACDDAGIAVQIDKAILARIDRRQKYFKPAPTPNPHVDQK